MKSPAFQVESKCNTSKILRLLILIFFFLAIDPDARPTIPTRGPPPARGNEIANDVVVVVVVKQKAEALTN